MVINNKYFKHILIILSVFWFVNANSQVSFGPSISYGLSWTDNREDSINFSVYMAPSVGLLLEVNPTYWLGLRFPFEYSFKNIKGETDDGQDQLLRAQFVDISIIARFSDFDSESKYLPYAALGYINSILTFSENSKGDFFIDKPANTYVPGFITGIGVGYKISYFTTLDLSLNYSRTLVPIYADGKNTNRIYLQVLFLF